MDFSKQRQDFHLWMSSMPDTALGKKWIEKKINCLIYLIYLKALVKINLDHKDEADKRF